ncbi:MAG: phosphatidylglycerol lysyltransferase domain-containing protein, partial [Candidatus Omnitrophica bacterium]|nr:phosphatidylglycerol lysyltransferase domain-containing protein [Candidatus Omnitrophota bacterium]
MKLKSLTLKHRPIFDRFLKFRPHRLAVYAFENIYIWRGIFEIYWLLIKGHLCIFFRDKMGWFLYLPPLAKKLAPEAVFCAWEMMEELNRDNSVSRIENIEEDDLAFFKDLGFIVKSKSYDYLCSTQEIVELKGNRFKSKRSCFNYFVKNYSYEYIPFSLKYRKDCLELYRFWMQQRKLKNKDRIYCGMLEDSFSSLKVLLDNYMDLKCTGRLVRIDR